MRLEEHQEGLKGHQEEIDSLQETRSLTKKLQEFVKHMDNELTKAEFKIDNIIPLVTQAQVSECLYAVLPPKMRKRISIHEYKKYFHLNREVLEKNYKEVREKFKGYELLEEMQRRNTKEIVQLKRNRLLAMGVDIDHLTYEQRERYYNEMVLEDALDDDDEVKVSAKVDEKQVLAVVDKFFLHFTQEVSEKVKIELGDSKKYLYALEEEVRH